MSQRLVALSTVATALDAERIATALVERGLAACVNIGAIHDSLYHWRGEIETAEETPLAVKTRNELFARVEEVIRRRHPYELPEIVAVPITDGSAAYLDWIIAETAPVAA